MPAEQFFSTIKSATPTKFIGLEDTVDKLSYIATTIVLLICVAAIGVKQYFLESISCYAATMPSGDQFSDYMNNYCWMHGTIPIHENETLPTTNTEWDILDSTNRIVYYQWVPFVLSLQCLLFFFPHIIWRVVSFNINGLNVDSIIKLTKKADSKLQNERKKDVKFIARQMFKTFCRSNKGCCNLECKLCICYFLLKFLYFFNAISQLILMHSFLCHTNQFGEKQNTPASCNTPTFGFTLTFNLLSGKHWQETGAFPRVTFCIVRGLRHIGTDDPRYTAQCAMPFNMLYEKIYIFLFWWICLVVVASLANLLFWAYTYAIKLPNDCILNYLAKEDNGIDLKALESTNFQKDGLFLLIVISHQTNSMIAAEILKTICKLNKGPEEPKKRR